MALILLAGLQYRLWFAQGSLAEQKRLEHQLEDQTEINRTLRDRNSVIEREVHDLKSGNLGLEQRAREQLGLIKEDEVFYQVIDSPAAEPNHVGTTP